MKGITLEGIVNAAQEIDLVLYGFAGSGTNKFNRFTALFITEQEQTELDIIAEHFRLRGFLVASIKYRIEQTYVDTSQIYITFTGE